MGEADNKQMLVLFGVIVAVLLMILGSILGLRMPAVPVCVMVLLEAGMALCLHDVPVWLHGVVLLAQALVGALAGKLVFMILCAAMYLVFILSLRFWRS